MFEFVILVIAVVFLAGCVLTVFVGAWSGKDLAAFNRCKVESPRTYRNLRAVCRFNGPLVAMMCVVGILSAPLVAIDPQGGVPLALAQLIGSAMFLWLSVRWFRWSLRRKVL